MSMLSEIKQELDGDIKKKQLEDFLKNNESFIKERLGLINFILEGFNADEEYEKLKNKNEEINKDIQKLRYIKDNIIIYYAETFKEIIQKIITIIRDNEKKK